MRWIGIVLLALGLAAPGFASAQVKRPDTATQQKKPVVQKKKKVSKPKLKAKAKPRPERPAEPKVVSPKAVEPPATPAPAAPEPRKPQAKQPLSREEAIRRYREGLAREQAGDERGAFEAYRDAAESGHGFAQRKLGEMYDKGNSAVARDYDTSLRWYQKAREQGVAIPKPHAYTGGR